MSTQESDSCSSSQSIPNKKSEAEGWETDESAIRTVIEKIERQTDNQPGDQFEETETSSFRRAPSVATGSIAAPSNPDPESDSIDFRIVHHDTVVDRVTVDVTDTDPGSMYQRLVAVSTAKKSDPTTLIGSSVPLTRVLNGELELDLPQSCLIRSRSVWRLKRLKKAYTVDYIVRDREGFVVTPETPAGYRLTRKPWYKTVLNNSHMLFGGIARSIVAAGLLVFMYTYLPMYFDMNEFGPNESIWIGMGFASVFAFEFTVDMLFYDHWVKWVWRRYRQVKQ